VTRALYRCLLWMHPPFFRREFAGEMLWIFDESAPAGSVGPLFADGLASLARQWFLRSGYWKIVAALAGAVFQVTMGGALMFRVGPQRARTAASVVETPELLAVMRLAALTAVGLLAAVILLVFWWRTLARRTGV
jgi:uncharacterized membrane protein